jgi:hypothetical protein
VVASVTSRPEAATSRRAWARARSQRVSPLSVRAIIDHEESITISRRPGEAAAARPAGDGRVTANASARAIAMVTTRDTALRMRSHSVRSRASSSTRRHSRRDGTITRGGRSLSRNSHAANPPAAASNSHACQAAMAPNVTRGTVPAGTP